MTAMLRTMLAALAASLAVAAGAAYPDKPIKLYIG